MPRIRKKSVAGDCSLNVNENNNFYVVLECLETQVRKVYVLLETATLQEVYKYMDFIRDTFNNFHTCFAKDFDLSNSARIAEIKNYFAVVNRFWNNSSLVTDAWNALYRNPNLNTEENFDARMYWRDVPFVGLEKIKELIYSV